MPKVLNTRPQGQNQELSALLSEAGFEPVEIPLVEIIPLESGLQKLKLLQPSGYTGIFLSSPNGLRQMQNELGQKFETWMQKPFFLVGGKSKTLIEKLGGKVEFFPREASVSGFLKEFAFESVTQIKPNGMVYSQRWLHPCSEATKLNPSDFKQRGIELDNIPVYRPEAPSGLQEKLVAEFPDCEALIFCSTSAVQHFFTAIPKLTDEIKSKQNKLILSIGPSTTQALNDCGIKNVHVATEANNIGLVEALKAVYSISETKLIKKNHEEKS